MLESTPGSASYRRCARCGAVIAEEDKFCAVCGGTAETLAPPGQRQRGLVLLAASAACLLLVFGVVAWIYFSAPERHQDHPVAHLANGEPYGLAILPGGTPVAFSITGGLLSLSSDGGTNWQRIALDGQVKAIGAGGDTGSSVLFAGTRLWRGNGQGVDQIATDLPVAQVRAIAVDPRDSRQAYAVVPGRGLFKSADAGNTWSLVSPNLPADATSLAISGDGLLFLGTAANGVFLSGDGQGWSNANGFVNGALPTRAIAAVAFDPASGDRYVGPSGETLTGALYAGTDGGLYKSIDGGRSWSALPLHHPLAALAVDPTGRHLMLAVDVNGDVYRSTDGGNSWQ